MKTEFLKGLGLTDEQISSIMAENGKDIAKEQTKATQTTEKVSQELENLKSQLNEKDQLIAEANSQIDKFKGMDIDSVKQSASDWENKYKAKEEEFKTKEAEYQKSLQDQQYNFKLNEIAGQHKFVDDLAKEAFINNLKKQEFKFGEDGTLQGANDYINKFKEDHKGIFVVEEPTKPSFEFTAPTGGQAPQKKMSLSEAMKIANQGGKVDFNQLG